MPEPSADPATTDDTSTSIAAGVQPLVLEPAAATPVEVEKAATKRLGVFGWVALVWLVAVVFGAIFAPILPIPAPDKKFLIDAGAGPSLSHPFGVDGIGQDMFSRVIWGARASLTVSVFSVVLGLVGGGVLGLIAGYYRGRIDTLLSYVFNTFLAIPQLVLALAIVAVKSNDPAKAQEAYHFIFVDLPFSQREFWLILSIGIVSIPVFGRIARASTLAWAQREFVLAGRAMGARNSRIIVREVTPNVLPAMFSIALLGVAVVIVLEGGLSILGVGIPAATPSWGNLIAIGRNELTKIVGAAPQVIFAPSIAIFLTVLSLNYLGDVVRARFDVRESAI
jgi:peptide/nickel transport system permease protein